MVFLGALKGSILCSLLSLIYIKSNDIVSTIKKIENDDILFFHCYAKALAGKLNPDL